jgi:hypothetical protein
MVEKDPFGDKLREKERADEDRYFAERDRALLEKMRAQDDATRETTLQEIARGRCPKCGHRLEGVEMETIVVEHCPSCRGLWLDEGELRALSHRESESWLARLLRQRLKETR